MRRERNPSSIQLSDTGEKKLQQLLLKQRCRSNINNKTLLLSTFRLGHSAVVGGPRPAQGGTQGCQPLRLHLGGALSVSRCWLALMTDATKRCQGKGKSGRLLRYDNYHKRADDCSCKTSGKNTWLCTQQSPPRQCLTEVCVRVPETKHSTSSRQFKLGFISLMRDRRKSLLWVENANQIPVK